MQPIYLLPMSGVGGRNPGGTQPSQAVEDKLLLLLQGEVAEWRRAAKIGVRRTLAHGACISVGAAVSSKTARTQPINTACQHAIHLNCIQLGSI